MKKLVLSVWLALYCLGSVFACARKATSQALLLIDGEKVQFTGRVEMKDEGAGLRPKLWVPGNIVVFRTDGTVYGQPGKAGHSYRMVDPASLEEIRIVDANQSIEVLAKEFGIP